MHPARSETVMGTILEVVPLADSAFLPVQDIDL